MTSQKQDTKTALTNGLQQSALLLGLVNAKYEVQDYTSPIEIEKYCILNSVNVLFTVKASQGVTGRFLQNTPHINKNDFIIGVWCVFQDTAKKADYSTLRDAAIAEVERVFKTSPSQSKGIEKNLLGDDDYRHGAIYVLSSSVTITKTTHS